MMITIRTIYKDKIDSRKLSYKKYTKIIYSFIKFMMQEIIDGKVIKLPFYLGKIAIIGNKIKPKIINGKIVGLAPDWGATNKLWKEDEEAKKNKTLIWHLNEETGGIRYRITYMKDTTKLINRSFYNLIFSYTNKRTVAKNIKAGKEYIIIKSKKERLKNKNIKND